MIGRSGMHRPLIILPHEREDFERESRAIATLYWQLSVVKEKGPLSLRSLAVLFGGQAARSWDGSPLAALMDFYSIRSLTFACARVCHCMLSGESAPPCFNA
jgi:hypothetical protein